MESLQCRGDRFALRWTHSPARYEDFQEFSRLYEDQAAGLKCMFSRNIKLQHQVALDDLKSCKSALSRSGARGAQGNGRAEKQDPSRCSYTQAPDVADGDRSNSAAPGARRAVAVLTRLVLHIDTPNWAGARSGIVPLVNLRHRPPGSVPGKKRETRGFPPGARGSSHTLSRPHLPPCVLQWYPGKGLLLSGPR